MSWLERKVSRRDLIFRESPRGILLLVAAFMGLKCRQEEAVRDGHPTPETPSERELSLEEIKRLAIEIPVSNTAGFFFGPPSPEELENPSSAILSVSYQNNGLDRPLVFAFRLSKIVAPGENLANKIGLAPLNELTKRTTFSKILKENRGVVLWPADVDVFKLENESLIFAEFDHPGENLVFYLFLDEGFYLSREEQSPVLLVPSFPLRFLSRRPSGKGAAV